MQWYSSWIPCYVYFQWHACLTVFRHMF